jgi:molybdopterin converting factor subunit 1
LKKIAVHYFAVLREQAGTRAETVETQAETALQLYEELKAKYSFTLPASLVKAAVNLELRDAASPICDGDQVVFIPPVAGG